MNALPTVIILIAVTGVVLTAVKWAFLPSVPYRRLPRHRVRYLRLRLHLRLHPGPGHATVAELWLRWGRFAAFRRSARARRSLSFWQRALGPASAYSILVGRAHYRHRLHLPVEEHAVVTSPPRGGKTGWLASVILHYPGPVLSTTTKHDVFELTSGIRARRGRKHPVHNGWRGPPSRRPAGRDAGRGEQDHLHRPDDHEPGPGVPRRPAARGSRSARSWPVPRPAGLPLRGGDAVPDRGIPRGGRTGRAAVRLPDQRTPLHRRPAGQPDARRAARPAAADGPGRGHPDLPILPWLADSGSKGIQIITVAHGDAQLRTRWGPDGARVIMDPSGAKIGPPGITDPAPLDAASILCGTTAVKETGHWLDRHHERHDYIARHPAMTPDMIRQLPAGHALVIRGGHSPVIARLPMAWKDAAYRTALRNGHTTARLIPITSRTNLPADALAAEPGHEPATGTTPAGVIPFPAASAPTGRYPWDE